MSDTSSDQHLPGRGRIYASVTETIGDTPVVQLSRLPQLQDIDARVLVKLEFFNPLLRSRIASARR